MPIRKSRDLLEIGKRDADKRQDHHNLSLQINTEYLPTSRYFSKRKSSQKVLQNLLVVAVSDRATKRQKHDALHQGIEPWSPALDEILLLTSGNHDH